MSQRRQSSLEGNESSHGRIREAVLSGFDVTRESILENRVSLNRYDQVVPAMELVERQFPVYPLFGMKHLCGYVLAGIGVENVYYGWAGGDIGNDPLDRAAMVASILRLYVQSACAL